ncbi:MAG: type IV secretion system DNA-binding domain-containing protein [bacterium]|nr:type IV secretion system DNA-binding domain-containing protein [bacterium]
MNDVALAVGVGIVCCLAAWLSGLYGALRAEPEASEPEPIRGRRLLPQATVAEHFARSLESSGDRALAHFGGVPFSGRHMLDGVCVAGATGSGKSLTIAPLIDAAARDILSSNAIRAKRLVVLDVKGDALARVSRQFDGRLSHLAPFEAGNTSCWDIAADCVNPPDWDALTLAIVPDRAMRNPWFPEAARRLLRGVLQVFNRTAPGKWTWRDVVLASDKDHLKHVLESLADTKPLADEFFSRSTEGALGAISTFAVAVRQVEAAAASWWLAWQDEERRVSIKSWLAGKSPETIVVGFKPLYDAASRQVFRTFFGLLESHLLSEGEHPQWPRTFVFADELPLLGGWDARRLLNAGRSKGVATVIGYQSKAHMIASYDRDQHLVTSIVESPRLSAYFGTASPETAKHFERCVGYQEAREWKSAFGESTTGMSATSSSSSSEENRLRPIVMDAEFLNLPKPSRETPLIGYFVGPDGAVWKGVTPPSEFAPVVDSRESPIDPAQLVLPLWNGEDMKRLGLPALRRQSSPTDDRKRARKDLWLPTSGRADD